MVLKNCFALAAALLSLFVAPLHGSAAQKQVEEPEQDLNCWPAVLYRGDMLMVDLPMPHEGSEFAIRRGYEDELLMISFDPLPKDTIAPVIPPAVFTKMTRIRLVPTEAKASPGTYRFQAPAGPTALKPPELIFAKTAHYDVMLGYNFGAEDWGEYVIGGCGADYFDRARPTPGEEVPKDALFVPENAGPHHNRKLELTCPPDTSYRGDTVTLGLPKFHQHYQFGVVDPGWNMMLLSFVPRDFDTAVPVIPPRNFSQMKQMRLPTDTARGIPYRPPGPIVAPLQQLFTRSGWYLAVIGNDFTKDDNGAFGTCWFQYINEPRAKEYQSVSEK